MQGRQWVDDTPAPWKILIFNIYDPFPAACGGSILDSTTILTAASCFPSRPNNNTYFYAGDNSVQLIDDLKIKGVVRSIDSAKYDFFEKKNDIVIVKLDKALKLKNDTQRACLPNPEAEYQEASGCFIGKWKANISACMYLILIEGLFSITIILGTFMFS